MSARTAQERVIERHGHKYIRVKSGRLLTFWNAIDAARAADTDMTRAVSRAFKLADADWDLESLEAFLDNVEMYVAHVRAEIHKRRGIHNQRQRIELLRNTTGRTPEEAVAYRRKADELEAALLEQGGSDIGLSDEEYDEIDGHA